MSDKPDSQASRRGLSEHDSSTTRAADAAAQKMSSEGNRLVALPVTDLGGEVCKRQPKENQIPVLQAGKNTDGCDYLKVDPARPADKQTPPFNTAELYKKAAESTTRVLTKYTNGQETHDGQGSGVIMGKKGDACYIATVDHNIHPPKELDLKRLGPTRVVMPNGKEYESKVQMSDPKTDRAVLQIPMGKDIADCKPAQFADKPEPGSGITAGFPEDTKSLHVSPTSYQHMVHPKPVSSYKPPDNLTENAGRGEPGNSGGPMFSPSGKVHSLVEGPGKNAMRVLRGTPINESDVKEWMSKT